MKKDTSDRKTQLQVLANRFGFCGCKDRCQVQEYADESMQDKPNGRYSVCELEAGEYGIKIPEKED